MTILLESIQTIDDKLSNRYIALDPGGYWLIYLDRDAELICVKHFANDINEQGLAVDPETGEVIPCKGVVERKPTIILQARTAKELCVNLFESEQSYPITMLNHAAYLGRELVRAEIALMNGTDYIQD
jgi:dihydropteroate synthase